MKDSTETGRGRERVTGQGRSGGEGQRDNGTQRRHRECTLFLDMLYPSVLETGRNPLHLMILEHCDTQTHWGTVVCVCVCGETGATGAAAATGESGRYIRILLIQVDISHSSSSSQEEIQEIFKFFIFGARRQQQQQQQQQCWHSAAAPISCLNRSPAARCGMPYLPLLPLLSLPQLVPLLVLGRQRCWRRRRRLCKSATLLLQQPLKERNAEQ